MRRKNIDLVVICLLALLTFYLALGKAGGPDPTNNLPLWFTPIGLLMVILIPGYALIAALSPQTDWVATLLLSLVLSLSIDILSALALNLTPWGLRPISWAILLGTLTLILSLSAAFRRRNNIERGTVEKVLSPFLTWKNGLIFGCAAIVVAIGIGLVLQNESKVRIAFTQLWALPAAENGKYVVNIGINNLERQTMNYDLYADEDGVKVQEWPKIVLAPGQTWTGQISFLERPSSVVRLSLSLLDAPSKIYRMVQIDPASFDLVITPTPTAIAP